MTASTCLQFSSVVRGAVSKRCLGSAVSYAMPLRVLVVSCSCRGSLCAKHVFCGTKNQARKTLLFGVGGLTVAY